MSKLCEYIRKKGLTQTLVAKEMGVRRQALSQYGCGVYSMNANTIKRVAVAMTALGVPTTVADIVAVVSSDEN